MTAITGRRCVGTLAAAATRFAVADPPRRPNVIRILTDDQGYGDLGWLGNQHLRTPQLDHLHSESVRLTNFHVAPLRSPSRSATMANVFAANGYRAAIRRDMAANGFWAVRVERAGLYRFTLRERPVEAPEPMKARRARLKIGAVGEGRIGLLYGATGGRQLPAGNLPR